MYHNIPSKISRLPTFDNPFKLGFFCCGTLSLLDFLVQNIFSIFLNVDSILNHLYLFGNHVFLIAYMSSPCHIEMILAEKGQVVSKAEDEMEIKKVSKKKEKREKLKSRDM